MAFTGVYMPEKRFKLTEVVKHRIEKHRDYIHNHLDARTCIKILADRGHQLPYSEQDEMELAKNLLYSIVTGTQLLFEDFFHSLLVSKQYEIANVLGHSLYTPGMRSRSLSVGSYMHVYTHHSLRDELEQRRRRKNSLTSKVRLLNTTTLEEKTQLMTSNLHHSQYTREYVPEVVTTMLAKCQVLEIDFHEQSQPDKSVEGTHPNQLSSVIEHDRNAHQNTPEAETKLMQSEYGKIQYDQNPISNEPEDERNERDPSRGTSDVESNQNTQQKVAHLEGQKLEHETSMEHISKNQYPGRKDETCIAANASVTSVGEQYIQNQQSEVKYTTNTTGKQEVEICERNTEGSQIEQNHFLPGVPKTDHNCATTINNNQYPDSNTPENKSHDQGSSVVSGVECGQNPHPKAIRLTIKRSNSDIAPVEDNDPKNLNTAKGEGRHEIRPDSPNNEYHGKLSVGSDKGQKNEMPERYRTDISQIEHKHNITPDTQDNKTQNGALEISDVQHSTVTNPDTLKEKSRRTNSIASAGKTKETSVVDKDQKTDPDKPGMEDDFQNKWQTTAVQHVRRSNQNTRDAEGQRLDSATQEIEKNQNTHSDRLEEGSHELDLTGISYVEMNKAIISNISEEDCQRLPSEMFGVDHTPHVQADKKPNERNEQTVLQTSNIFSDQEKHPETTTEAIQKSKAESVVTDPGRESDGSNTAESGSFALQQLRKINPDMEEEWQEIHPGTSGEGNNQRAVVNQSQNTHPAKPGEEIRDRETSKSSVMEHIHDKGRNPVKDGRNKTEFNTSTVDHNQDTRRDTSGEESHGTQSEITEVENTQYTYPYTPEDKRHGTEPATSEIQPLPIPLPDQSEEGSSCRKEPQALERQNESHEPKESRSLQVEHGQKVLPETKDNEDKYRKPLKTSEVEHAQDKHPGIDRQESQRINSGASVFDHNQHTPNDPPQDEGCGSITPLVEHFTKIHTDAPEELRKRSLSEKLSTVGQSQDIKPDIPRGENSQMAHSSGGEHVETLDHDQCGEERHKEHTPHSVTSTINNSLNADRDRWEKGRREENGMETRSELKPNQMENPYMSDDDSLQTQRTPVNQSHVTPLDKQNKESHEHKFPGTPTINNGKDKHPDTTKESIHKTNPVSTLLGHSKTTHSDKPEDQYLGHRVSGTSAAELNGNTDQDTEEDETTRTQLVTFQTNHDNDIFNDKSFEESNDRNQSGPSDVKPSKNTPKDITEEEFHGIHSPKTKADKKHSTYSNQSDEIIQEAQFETPVVHHTQDMQLDKPRRKSHDRDALGASDVECDHSTHLVVTKDECQESKYSMSLGAGHDGITHPDRVEDGSHTAESEPFALHQDQKTNREEVYQGIHPRTSGEGNNQRAVVYQSQNTHPAKPGEECRDRNTSRTEAVENVQPNTSAITHNQETHTALSEEGSRGTQSGKTEIENSKNTYPYTLEQYNPRREQATSEKEPLRITLPDHSEGSQEQNESTPQRIHTEKTEIDLMRKPVWSSDPECAGITQLESSEEKPQIKQRKQAQTVEKEGNDRKQNIEHCLITEQVTPGVEDEIPFSGEVHQGNVDRRDEPQLTSKTENGNTHMTCPCTSEDSSTDIEDIFSLSTMDSHIHFFKSVPMKEVIQRTSDLSNKLKTYFDNFIKFDNAKTDQLSVSDETSNIREPMFNTRIIQCCECPSEMEIDSLTWLVIRVILPVIQKRAQLLTSTNLQKVSFLNLAEIAACGMLKEEVAYAFDECYLKDNSLIADDEALGGPGDSVREGNLYERHSTTTFLSVIVHAFLTAFHLAVTWNPAQVDCLTRPGSRHLDIIQTFVCGLLGDPEGLKFLQAADPQLLSETAVDRAKELLASIGPIKTNFNLTSSKPTRLHVLLCVAEGKMASHIKTIEGAILEEKDEHQILDLSGYPNGLLPHHLAAVGYWIQSSTLTILDLCDCQIDQQGIAALEHNTKEITSLKILVLANNCLGDKGAKYLAQLLVRGPTLKKIHVDENQIRDEGAAKLADAVGGHEGIKTLYLSGNRVSNQGAMYLAETLLANHRIDALSLVRNNISENARTKLRKEFGNRIAV